MVDREYSTPNLALAAYCALYGLKYVRTDIGKARNGRDQVYFVFEDEAGIGNELEREFIGSREKKFRDFLYFFRNVVDEALISNERKIG